MRRARPNTETPTLGKYDSSAARLIMWEHSSRKSGGTLGLPGVGALKVYDHGAQSRAEIGRRIVELTRWSYGALKPSDLLILDKHGAEYPVALYLDAYHAQSRGHRPALKNGRRARNNPPESIVALRAKFRHQYGNNWASDPKIKALYDAEKRALLHPPKRAATPAPPPPRATAPRAAAAPHAHRVPTCDDCGSPATRMVMDESFGMKRPFCDFHGEEHALANPRSKTRMRRRGDPRWDFSYFDTLDADKLMDFAAYTPDNEEVYGGSGPFFDARAEAARYELRSRALRARIPW